MSPVWSLDEVKNYYSLLWIRKEKHSSIYWLIQDLSQMWERIWVSFQCCLGCYPSFFGSCPHDPISHSRGPLTTGRSLNKIVSFHCYVCNPVCCSESERTDLVWKRLQDTVVMMNLFSLSKNRQNKKRPKQRRWLRRCELPFRKASD